MPLVAEALPLRGAVKDRQGRQLAPDQSPNLVNVWRERGEIRPRFGMASFGDVVTAKPVQNLFLADLATGAQAILRADDANVYKYNGTAWASLAAAAPDFSATTTSPFGMAMCLNELIISNGKAAAAGNDGVFRWTGGAAIAQVAASGILTGNDNCFRYVAPFANRVVGAYTSDASTGPWRVIYSATGSTTDWTTANGAGVVVRNEHPSVITGLSSTDTELFLWRERAISTATETGDPDAPFYWTLLRTDGIGLRAPRALGAYGGLFFGLSHEGFFVLSGGTPQFIDADIRRDFAQRFNQAALRQIHHMIMPEFSKTVWFVPEGTDLYPKAAWVYDWALASWDRWEFGSRSITAACRAPASTGLVIDSQNVVPIDVIDTGSRWAGVIIDQLGGGTSNYVYLMGCSDGRTVVLDPAAADDLGSTFPLIWDTPDFDFFGQRDEQTGMTIGPSSLVCADEAVLTYRYSGAPAPNSPFVEVLVSVDGGNSWQLLEGKNLVASNDQYAQLRFNGRVSGTQFRVRVSISGVIGTPYFRELNVSGMYAGERR